MRQGFTISERRACGLARLDLTARAGRATGYGMAQDQDHRSVRFKRASSPVVRR